MRFRLAFALLVATGCNSVLGIPDVELQTCTNPIAPEGGYGTVNLSLNGNVLAIPSRITLRGNLNTATRPDQLQLEIFDGSSFPGGADPVPGNYDIVGNQIIYDAANGCGICIRLFTQVDTNGMGASSIYMARSGTLRLTTVSGGRLVGSLENIELRRVNITASPNFVTTDHSSNCATHIERADFDLPIVADVDAGSSLDAL